MKVEFRQAPAGALGESRRRGEHEGRAVEVVDQARGDDADDAFMPAVTDRHDRVGVADLGRRGLDLRDRLGGDGLLDFPSLGVERPQFVGDRPRARQIVFEQQRQRVFGMPQPAGRVDDRRERVAERAGVERARVDARYLAHRADAGARGLAHLSEAADDQAPVLPDQRHRVGHRR